MLGGDLYSPPMLEPNVPRPEALILAIDTGSPRVSLALGRNGKVLKTRDFAQSSASGHLLTGIAECLAELGATSRDLGGVVALAGPGSFTGLRVGLATALGLHQSLGVPALALPSFEALAASAGRSPVVAVVDALRGEWFAQSFVGDTGALRALGESVLLKREDLWALAPTTVTGFGVTAALGGPGAPAELLVLEPPPLAPSALVVAARWPGAWDALRLAEPLYLRPPAVTLPLRRGA